MTGRGTVRSSAVAAAAVVALALGGCTGEGASEQPQTSGAPTATEPTGTTAAPGPDVSVPDTPVGRQVGWVLEVLDAPSGPEPAEAAERFAASFLAQVPADSLPEVFDQLRAVGPFTVEAYDGTDTEAVVLLGTASAGRFRLTAVVDAEGRMTGLLVQPAAEVPQIADWAELEQALASSGAQVSLLAARSGPQGCEPVHERDAATAVPLGSVFKLYVLGALTTAVAEGAVSWDDTVTVTDELRSLPSGRLQDLPAGTEVPLAEAAEAMIAISDNTATDLIIDLVGRDRVEAAVADMGHHEPALLRPFLTTREMFRLMMGDDGLPARWEAADEAERRQILAGLPSGAPELDASAPSVPLWQQGVEWFASAADVCAAHLALQDLAAEVPEVPVRDILSANPGVAVDAATWPYLGFKGGSDAGVLAFSWYAESPEGDGSVLVVALRSRDAAALADQVTLAETAVQGLDLLRR